MKPSLFLRRFLVIAGSAVLTISYAQAATYYWEGNTTAAGYGTATGTWAAPTTGTATQGWTTATNGTTAPSASITTATTDTVNFGNGTTGLGAGTITVSGTVATGGITFASGSGAIVLSGGTINFAAASTITVNNSTDTISSILSGAATSLTKAGDGILILGGDNSYSGTTIINAGTLNLGGGTADGSLASTVLTLNGGAIDYTRTGNTTQGFTTTNINAGLNSITVVSGNTLDLGTVARGTGGTLDFNNVGAGIVAALVANNDATGIMAGFTFGDSWAVANGTGVAISGLANGSYTLSSVAGTTAASYLDGNIDVDSSAGALDAAITANSLRFSAAAANTMTLTGTTNVITSGGILVGSGVGNNLSTITGGTLAGANTKDLLITQNNTLGGLTISSSVGNNTGATALVKSGAGVLTLSGSNTFTGGLVINAGTVALGNTGALFSTAGSENNVTFGSGSTGTLAMNGTSLVVRSLNTNTNNAGTTFVENGNATPATLTIGNSANAVSTFGGVIRDGTGGGALTITKVGTGALNLGTSNTYSGGTNLNGATSFIFRPGMFGTGLITVNANTTMDVDYGAYYQYANALHVSGGVTLTTTGGTQYFGQTFNGAVTGSGIIQTGASSNDANTREKLGLYSASNTFTGNLVNKGGGAIIRVNSLGDGGKLQLYTGTGGFELGTGTATPLLFNTRQVELFGSSVIANQNATASNTITINTNLTYNGTGVRTLTLGGSNTGNNTFGGNIVNNGASAVSVTKAGAGKWILSGTNTYSGTTINGFNNPANAGLVFNGMQALSPNTTLQQTHAGGTGGFGIISLLDDNAAPASRSTVNINMLASNTSHTMTLYVNRNAGTNTGSTIELGNLNFTQNVVGNTSQTLSVTGANSYGLQINQVQLPSTVGNWNGVLSATSAPLTVAGNVQQKAGSTAGTMTLTLDGTNTGNSISGDILNSADGSPRTLTLTKTNTAGAWTLSGTNAYTGNTTISGGRLEIGGGGTLGSGSYAGTISIASTNSGRLVYNSSANQTLSGVISGAGALIKDNTGTLTVTNTNTYSGATTITGGTYAVDGTGAINSSAVTLNGGTFRYNSSVDYSGTFTFTSGTIAGTNLNGSLGGQTIGAGQTIAPGNSPGTALTTSQTWATGGSYAWEINDVDAGAGSDPGWDLINGSGALTISASSGSEFNLLLSSLALANTAGLVHDFVNGTSYNWLIADFASVTGFAADAFTIDTTGFTNPFTGTFGVALGNTGGIGGDNTQIYLTYTAVPEPGAALIGSLSLLLLLRRRRN